MKIHALAYYRTSSAANVGEGKDSLPRQRSAVADYAHLNDLQIIAEYYDAAMAGIVPVHERPEFGRLLSHIEGNGVRVVLIERMRADLFAICLFRKLGWPCLRTVASASSRLLATI